MRQSAINETQTQLQGLLRQWNRRWRLRQIVLYLPRVIMAMCGVGVLVGLTITLTGLLPAMPMIVVSGIAMGVTFILITGGIGFWSKSTADYARQFDALFGSKERFATAFELMTGRIQSVEEITQRQLQDTYDFAREIDARKRIPLQVKWLEWAGAVIVIIVTLAILLFSAYTLSVQADAIGQATQNAIDSAADTTRDITGEIASNTDLTDEERSSLLESAEMTLSELENPPDTAEDSFVAMSDLESDLREQADTIQESTEASNEAMRAAMEALSGSQEDMENAGQGLSDELAELADNMSGLSPEEQANMVQSLQDAADALREQNDALSEMLEDAANAMQSDQSQQAQDYINEASQQARNEAQNNQERNETADSLRELAQQAQDAARDIAESEQQDAEQQEGGMESPEGDPQEAQEGEGGQQSSDDAPPAEEGESGSQPGEEGQPGDAGQDGDQGQNGEDGNPQQPGDNSQAAGEGGGSGGSESDASTQDITGADDGPIVSSADSDGGEMDYNPIFAPPPMNIQAGDSTLELDSDDSSTTTVEGDFQDNPAGESVVPYNQVFASYADAVNSALENGYVPLGVRDVVRDYFTSIEPTGNQAED